MTLPYGMHFISELCCSMMKTVFFLTVVLKGKDDMTTLHMAAQCGHNAVVRMLLEKSKLDINAKVCI